MQPLLNWLAGEHAERLCFVLLHSLWQAAALAGGLWLLLKTLPAHRAALRHALALASLCLLPATLTLTWSLLTPGSGDLDIAAAPSLRAPASTQPNHELAFATNETTNKPSTANAHQITSPLSTQNTQPPAAFASNTNTTQNQTANAKTKTPAAQPSLRDTLANWRFYALPTWACIATLLLLRTTLGLAFGRKRLTADAKPAPDWVQSAADALAKRLHLQTIPVLAHAEAAANVLGPCIVGVVKPVILLPPAAWLGLDAKQLEAILAHELAHAKRLDACVDACQRLLAAVLFFNPGLLWLNRMLRQEREACCDQTAGQLVGDSAQVADALHAMAQILRQQTNAQNNTTTATNTPQKQTTQASLSNALMPPVALHALGEPSPRKQSKPQASDTSQATNPLTDRVKRLLLPNQRPHVLMSWPTLVAVLLVSTVALLLLERGTQASVTLAEKLFKPEQHIENIQQITEANTIPEARVDDHNQVIDDDLITVSGSITTADGSPLPGHVNVYFSIQRQGTGGNSATSPKPDPDHPNTRLYEHTRLDPGMVSVIAQAKGFAMQATPPVRVLPGGRLDNVALVIDRGHDVPVRVVDAQGQPVAGLQLMAFTHFGNMGYGTPPTGPTDAQGLTVLPHIGHPDKLSVTIEDPNHPWHSVEWTGPFDDTTAPRTITLPPVTPVTGTVVDANTQQPIAHAQIHVMSRQGHHSYDPRNAWDRKDSLLTQTDAQGRFTLNTLPEGLPHSLWIEAPDKQPEVLYGIHGGDDPLHIALQPKLVLQVALPGSLDTLATNKDGQPIVSLSQALQVGQRLSHTGSSIQAIVTPTQDGGVATFDQTLLTGRARLDYGDRTLQIPSISEAVANGPLVIKLATTEETTQSLSRDVILKLVPPEGWPLPKGTLEVSFRKQAEHEYREKVDLTIESGQVRFTTFFWDKPNRKTIISPGRLDAPGYWLPDHRFDERLALQPATDPNDTSPQTFTLQIYPAGVITGQVVDEQGKPIPNASLALQKIKEPQDWHPDRRTNSSWWNNIDADENGRFLIPAVPFGGTYRVEATDRRLSRYAWTVGPNITLGKDNPQADCTLTIPRGKDIHIQVLDHKGQPILNAQSDLTRRTPYGSMGWSEQDTPQGQGTFIYKALNFDVPDVIYTVYIFPVDGNIGQTFSLKASQTEYLVQLQPGLVLHGKLLNDETGEPIANTTVTARQSFGATTGFLGNITVETDAQGRFVLSGLEQVTYDLSADHHFPAGSTINRHPDGSAKSVSSKNWPTITMPMQTSANKPHELRVVPNPWH